METTELGMLERTWGSNRRTAACRVGAKCGPSASDIKLLCFLHLPPPACMQHGDTHFWLTATSRRSTSPILYLCLCQSWGISRELSYRCHFPLHIHFPLSSVMIKGNASYSF